MIGHYGLLVVEGLVDEGVGDLPGVLRAHVSAASPPGLSQAALLAVGAYGSGLVVAALLLLESSGGATGLAGGAASSGGSAQGACGAITTG